MQPVQIAMSGVTPGTYGNEKQIPTFTVDVRGRLVFAANVDVNQILKTRLDDRVLDVNLLSDELRFRSGSNINIHYNDKKEYEFSLASNLNIRGNFEGTLTGTLVGNAMGVSTGTLTISGSTIKSREFGNDEFNDSDTIVRFGTESEPTTIIGNSTRKNMIFKGLKGDAGIEFKTSSGSLITPEKMTADDPIFSIKGWAHNGDRYQQTGSLGFRVDRIEDSKNVYGTFFVAIPSKNGNISKFGFTSNGVLMSPIVQSLGYNNSTERDTEIQSPVGGMIVYMKDTGQFVGWNDVSKTWVNLG